MPFFSCAYPPRCYWPMVILQHPCRYWWPKSIERSHQCIFLLPLWLFMPCFLSTFYNKKLERQQHKSSWHSPFFPQLFRWCRSLPQPWTRLCKSNININLWATRQSGVSPVWGSYDHPELRGVCGPQPQQYLTPSEIRGSPSTCQAFLCSLKNQIHPHAKISNKIMNHSGTRDIFHSVPGNKINFCLSPVWEKCQDAKQKIYVFLYVFSYSL